MADADDHLPPHDAEDTSARPRLGRRSFLAVLAAAAPVLAQANPAASPTLEGPMEPDPGLPVIIPSFRGPRSVASMAEMRSEWAAFRRAYVAADGRVIDTAGGGVSHSEGQGSALLFAAEAGDLESFERILDWTRRSLGHRRDHLHSWRYVPSASVPVTDTNNATDGDILIAWGLQRAAERFGRPDFARLAARIAGDIHDLCTREAGGRLMLLPGTRGFEKADHLVVNPSYYIFPALLDFEALVPGPQWRRLVADGLEVCCRQGGFGRWGLPADWIEVPRDGAPVRPAADRPARFSWDAVRVPMNLAWGRHSAEPMLRASARFWAEPSHRGRVPAWVDLVSNQRAPYAGHAGVQAVALLAASACEGGRAPALPRVEQAGDYFGAALTLLARMAWQDASMQRVVA